MRKLTITIAIILVIVLAAGLGTLYVIGDRLLEEAIKAEMSVLEQELYLSLTEDLNASLNDMENGILEVSGHNNTEKVNSLEENQSKDNQIRPVADTYKDKSGKSTQNTGAFGDKTNDRELKGQTGASGGSNPGKEKSGFQNGGKKQTHEGPELQQESEPKANRKPHMSSEPKAGNRSQESSESLMGNKSQEASSEDADQETSSGKDARVFTPEKIIQVKDKVSPKDRIEASALALKRLSLSDVKELIAMLSGGVTKAEKERAIQIAYSRFTDVEIKRIKEMYAKYIR